MDASQHEPRQSAGFLVGFIKAEHRGRDRLAHGGDPAKEAQVPTRRNEAAQGPLLDRGEITALKPDYWLDIEEQGYALVRCELAVFKPEA